MIPVVNNFVFDSYIGNQVIELEARLNLIEKYSITNRELVLIQADDFTRYKRVIVDQDRKIELLTKALNAAVYKLNSLIVKKEKICTRLSEIIKSHFKLKREVTEKFDTYDKNLNLVINKLNSLSLN